MKKIKYIMITIFILLIIIIGTIITFKLNTPKNTETKNNYIIEDNEITFEEEAEKKTVSPINNYTEAYIVNECMQRYIYKLSSGEKAVDMLDAEFVKQNNITAENVFDKIEKMELFNDFYIKKIYKRKYDNNVKQYYISGRIISTMGSAGEPSEKERKLLYFSVILDKGNEAFAVIPYTEGQAEWLEGANIPILKYEAKNRIAKNNNNAYEPAALPDERTEPEKYVWQFLYEKNNFIDESYELLNKEYREIKFDSIEEYKEYARNFNYSSSDLTIFSQKQYDGFIQYVYTLTGNRKIVINRYHAMDFDVLLDTYTVDIEKLGGETYDLSKNEIAKQAIGQFIGNINEGNYEIIYNKFLNEEFKNNNFGSVDVFKKFIKDNLYEYNSFNYYGMEVKGGTYVCDVEVKNAQRVASETKKMQVIIKPTTKNKFEMSFSMKQD